MGEHQVLQQLEREFIDNQIFIPPIPERFVADLKRLDPLVYSTDKSIDTLQAYMFTPRVELLCRDGIQPHFFVGAIGHGDNSNVLTLSVGMDGVAVLVQISTGPIYTPFVECRVNIARAYVLLTRLLYLIPTEPTHEFIAAFSETHGGALLRKREWGKSQAVSNSAKWEDVDFEKQAVADGQRPTLDDGLFEWREPMDLEIAASKFLVDLSRDRGTCQNRGSNLAADTF